MTLTLDLLTSIKSLLTLTKGTLCVNYNPDWAKWRIYAQDNILCCHLDLSSLRCGLPCLNIVSCLCNILCLIIILIQRSHLIKDDLLYFKILTGVCLPVVTYRLNFYIFRITANPLYAMVRTSWVERDMQLEGSHQIILTLCEKLCQCRFHVFVYGFFELVLQDVTQRQQQGHLL